MNRGPLVDAQGRLLFGPQEVNALQAKSGRVITRLFRRALSLNAMTAADVATVTPELEAACRKLIDGVQLGGPYLPVSYNRLRVQFPGNHGGGRGRHGQRARIGVGGKRQRPG